MKSLKNLSVLIISTICVCFSFNSCGTKSEYFKNEGLDDLYTVTKKENQYIVNNIGYSSSDKIYTLDNFTDSSHMSKKDVIDYFVGAVNDYNKQVEVQSRIKLSRFTDLYQDEESIENGYLIYDVIFQDDDKNWHILELEGLKSGPEVYSEFYEKCSDEESAFIAKVEKISKQALSAAKKNNKKAEENLIKQVEKLTSNKVAQEIGSKALYDVFENFSNELTEDENSDISDFVTDYFINPLYDLLG